MSFIKDIVKGNKEILFLTLGLLVMSIVAVALMNNGNVNIKPITTGEGLYSRYEIVIEEGIDYQVVIKTIYGDIEIDLYEKESPNAVNSLLFLAKEGFYDDLTFHKVIKDFVIQAGDHQGDGNGNPGYVLERDENDLAMEEYSMSMVNGSQFFLVPSGSDLSQLSEYVVMGRVISGFSVVDTIEKVAVEGYTPLNDVTISSVLIVEK
ncbi:peptidylprolyl isomerase [bacterium]|nr:peptidylprolyl isomerase [bacterium]